MRKHSKNVPARTEYRKTSRQYISLQHIIFAALIIISIVLGLVFPMLREKFQYVLILIFPAAIIVLLVLRNPFLGVYLFFIYEFARPDNFFPALRPLKAAIIIQVVTALSFLFYIIINKKNINWGRFSTVFLFFLIVMATGVISAENNRYAYDYTQVMASAFLIYLIAINVVNSISRVKALVYILLIIHTYFAFKGIFTGGLVGGSLMGDENDYALALNVMLPFPFFFFMKSKKRLVKFIYLVILVAFVLGIISSMSRGGWVGLMAVLIYCVLRSRKKFAGFTILILLGISALLFAPSKYWEEIETISETHQGTARTRQEYWAAAVRMYLDYPLTGVGPANGGFRMPEYYSGARDAGTTWGRTFHGTLPQILAETGTLGMAAYLLMLYLALRNLFWLEKLKGRKNGEDLEFISKAIIGGIIGYFVTSIFLSTAYYPQIWTLYTITICLTLVCEGWKKSADRNLDKSSFIPEYI